MRMVNVSVVQPFEYRGRVYQPGEVAAMVPIEAAAAAQARLVNLSRPAVVLNRDLLPEDPPVEPDAPRRRYRRRDVQAEG